MSDRAPVVVVVSAPSGAGKTSVVARVLEEMPGILFSVSHTTRRPRGQEKDGVEYHFVTREAFVALRDAGGLLEWAEVHGNLYGTGMAEIERARAAGCDLLLDLDVQGAAQVRRRIPDAVTVFVLPPSFDVLERRLRGRGEDDEATIRRRLAAAGREIDAFAQFDYAIVNDDLDRCAGEFRSIVTAARCRVPVVAPRARAIERTFESVKETETT